MRCIAEKMLRPFLSCMCLSVTVSQKKDILVTVKEEINYIQKRILTGDCIPNGATTSFRHYCEAIMLLQHRLTVNAVMELSVIASDLLFIPFFINEYPKLYSD